MNAYELAGMVAALLNHFEALPAGAYSLDQLRDRMYEWPSMPPREELFVAAFKQLEDEGMIERSEIDGKSRWTRIRG